jgi:peptidoglycan L-alanyl-D-glutamate endopeptidase CwlK
MSLRREIQRLQRRVGVRADGIIGPVTVAACHAELDRLTLLDDDVNVIATRPPLKKAKEFTFDKRTEKNLATLEERAQGLFRPFIAAAQAVAASMGCDYLAISGNRGKEEQDALYAKGRTKPGPKVTNARYGWSNHNFGLALDFGVFRSGKYLDGDDPAKARRVHEAAGELASEHGIEWGGHWKRFKDLPHFEVQVALTMAQKRARLREGKSMFTRA